MYILPTNQNNTTPKTGRLGVVSTHVYEIYRIEFCNTTQ